MDSNIDKIKINKIRLHSTDLFQKGFNENSQQKRKDTSVYTLSTTVTRKLYLTNYKT